MKELGLLDDTDKFYVLPSYVLSSSMVLKLLAELKKLLDCSSGIEFAQLTELEIDSLIPSNIQESGEDVRALVHELNTMLAGEYDLPGLLAGWKLDDAKYPLDLGELNHSFLIALP